jgi:hypothetical protein
VASPAELARRLYEGYYKPRMRRRLGLVSRVRVDFVTIQVLHPDDRQGVAQVLMADGTVMVMPYMEIVPVEGRHWRALSIDGSWALDDAAPHLDAA